MKKSIIAMFALALPVAAFGGVQTLTFEEFKAACTNPARFRNQVPQSNIQISCKSVTHRWVNDSQGSMALEGSKDITTSITSDKYKVDAETSPQQQQDAVMACPSFKEVAETVETVRSLTCDEIVAYQGTPADYCSSALQDLVNSNPGAVVSQDTGNKKDLCQGKEQGQGQGQVRRH